MPLTSVTCYLFHEIQFYFHLCITGIPTDLHVRCRIVSDCINQPGDLDLCPSDL